MFAGQLAGGEGGQALQVGLVGLYEVVLLLEAVGGLRPDIFDVGGKAK